MATQREIYLDILGNVICPDPDKGDKFWTSSARKALLGMVVFLVNKIEAKNYSHIPDEYKGEEPSLPMLVDWLGEARSEADRRAETSEDDNEKQDPMKGFFKMLLTEAETANREWDRRRRESMEFAAANPEQPYARIAMQNLQSLGAINATTRGSILATLDEAIDPWTKRAVKERTRRSDFSFSDLRGTKDPITGDWKPTTIYLVIKQEQMEAFSKITTLFCELLVDYLIANGPKSTDVMGNKNGPFATLFMLDEFPQFPKMKKMLNMPAVGRSKKVMAFYVAQDEGQLKLKYSQDEVEALYTTVSAKIIQGQNNDRSAKRFSEMIGQYTYKEQNESKNSAGGGGKSGFSLMGGGGSKSYSWKGRALYSQQEMMSMPNDLQIVLIQDFANRPVLASRPFFYLNEKHRQLVRDVDKLGPAACSPMPAFARARLATLERADTKRAPTGFAIVTDWHFAETMYATLSEKPRRTVGPEDSSWTVRQATNNAPLGATETMDTQALVRLMRDNIVWVADEVERQRLLDATALASPAVSPRQVRSLATTYSEVMNKKYETGYDAVESLGVLEWFRPDTYTPTEVLDYLVTIYETITTPPAVPAAAPELLAA